MTIIASLFFIAWVLAMIACRKYSKALALKDETIALKDETIALQGRRIKSLESGLL